MKPPSQQAEMFPAAGRLKFAADLEPSFGRYHAEHSLPLARFGLVLAVLLYALFGVLDLYADPGAAGWIWVIRYAIFCPAALTVLGMTFTRCFKPLMQPLLSAVAAAAGLGIVAMVAITSPAVEPSLLRGTPAGRPVGVHGAAAPLFLRHDSVPGDHARLRGGRHLAQAHACGDPPQQQFLLPVGRHHRHGGRVHDGTRSSHRLPPAPRYRGTASRTRGPQRPARLRARCFGSAVAPAGRGTPCLTDPDRDRGRLRAAQDRAQPS